MNWFLAALQWVFKTPPVQWLLGALMLIGVIKARDAQQQRKGRKQAEQKQAQTDVEAAAEIHRRAAAARRVPDPDDTRGYRD